MKALLKYAPGHGNVAVREIPVPEPQPDELLIRVKYCGICGTDLHTYMLGMFKEMSLPQMDGSILFGHEFAGEVVEIGKNAQVGDIRVGDRVVGIALGAYAEYCQVTPMIGDTPLLARLPDNVSYEEAATLEPLTVSMSAVLKGGLQGGEKVLITGAGMIGLGCVQVIKALYPGCEVIISDVSENRLAMAREFSADRTVNVAEEDLVAGMKELTGEEFVLYNSSTSANIDVAIEASGLAAPLNQCLEVLKPVTGKLVIVALYENRPEADLNQVVSKNLSVTGVLGYTQELVDDCLALISNGKVDRKPLITHKYALAEASEAFESQLKTSETLKAIIKP